MAGLVFKRRAHLRKGRRGNIPVRECLVYRVDAVDRVAGSFPLKCEKCGAPIIRVRMPNGGTTFFEGRDGLTGVKHSCFSIGQGLSRRRDKDTPDLFPSEDGPDAPQDGPRPAPG